MEPRPKYKNEIPQWSKEEMEEAKREAKREEYYNKDEEIEEQEQLNDWINRGGY